jgi:nicotinate-nucleotide pyrophosphorylase (carboxylating)
VSKATLLAKADGVLAGQALANQILAAVDPELTVSWSKVDGDSIANGELFCEMHGKAHSILRAERVVLNFMQRMSGIATLTKAMADQAAPAYMLETRKTAPGLRLPDKWAVLIGGGKNHRMGLFDMIMIKDNHIAVGLVNLHPADPQLESARFLNPFRPMT